MFGLMPAFMKPFHFQKFTLQQCSTVFRVGTDGVLLGALCEVEKAKNVLEVGTGSGLISLMIAQRNSQAEILALDINSDAVKLAGENFTNSPYSLRLKTEQMDFKNFEPTEKFDLIVSNPPYFEENQSAKDVTARQQTELSFRNLIIKSAELLAENGMFSVIIPFSEGNSFENMCGENGLFLSRKIRILGRKNAVPKRWILEFGFSSKTIQEVEFTIEGSPRKYSAEYLELTKEFHLFKN